MYLKQDLPVVEQEGAGRADGSVDKPEDCVPHHQGSAEEVQDARGGGAREGRNREAGHAHRQPEPRQPSTEGSVHATEHRLQAHLRLPRGAHQR